MNEKKLLFRGHILLVLKFTSAEQLFLLHGRVLVGGPRKGRVEDDRQHWELFHPAPLSTTSTGASYERYGVRPLVERSAGHSLLHLVLGRNRIKEKNKRISAAQEKKTVIKTSDRPGAYYL